jgi:hypothetical protein
MLRNCQPFDPPMEYLPKNLAPPQFFIARDQGKFLRRPHNARWRAKINSIREEKTFRPIRRLRAVGGALDLTERSPALRDEGWRTVY